MKLPLVEKLLNLELYRKARKLTHILHNRYARVSAYKSERELETPFVAMAAAPSLNRSRVAKRPRLYAKDSCSNYCIVAFIKTNFEDIIFFGIGSTALLC
jgi:hypothetical protein